MKLIVTQDEELSQLITAAVASALANGIKEQVTPPPIVEFLTIQQASELLHKAVPTLYGLVHRGEIPGVRKRQGRLYFSRKELLQWIDDGHRLTHEQQAEAHLMEVGKQRRDHAS
ncbi:MAG TPA: helix-turn-helix domain-containing protein [Bacteroidales bacterium]|nr:helix-turn-helix domain-containing protein [Bacteroidales bacterium]HSA43749.1 helix-turn-helix domain-containing protein [Bacteroidales bacterium]